MILPPTLIKDVIKHENTTILFLLFRIVLFEDYSSSIYGGEKMHDNKMSKQEQYDFQKDKIKNLNKFFMKSVLYGTLLTFIMFILAVIILLITINTQEIDQTLKISIVSMIATFVLTTAKALIDKLIMVVTYIVRLLTEEQRGFSKNIGIDIDEVEFLEEKSDSENE